MSSRRSADSRRSSLYRVLLGFWIITVIASVCLDAVPQKSNAATITARSLALSKNVTSSTGTTYTFQATVPTGSTLTQIGSIEVDLCTTPFLGATCTAPTGLAFGAPSASALANPNPSAGTPVLNGAALSQTPNANLGTGSAAARIRVNWTSAQTVTAGSTVISFDITNIQNPSTVGTFYARMGFFQDTAWTTFRDAGAMANSVQVVQNLSFKIAETLAFCVGSMPNATVAFASFAAASLTNDCVQSAGASISLGTAPDPVTTCITPVSARSSSCDDASGVGAVTRYGYAMIRTNASAGATVGYRPNSSTNFTQGTAQQSGATGCVFTTRTDFCINPVNLDQGVANGTVTGWVGGTGTNEEFGMAIPAKNNTGRATNVLTRNSSNTGYGFTGNLSGGTTCSTSGTSSAMDCWNWHQTGNATLATAASPVDNEALQIFFASKVATVTPTGQYAVDIDYYANPQY